VAPVELSRQQKLKQAGKTLYGPEWTRTLAIYLGPHHPDGPRAAVDPRLVRRWAAGERDIPDWVFEAVRKIVLEKMRDLTSVITVLDT
jgi:hypothetical protein